MVCCAQNTSFFCHGVWELCVQDGIFSLWKVIIYRSASRVRLYHQKKGAGKFHTFLLHIFTFLTVFRKACFPCQIGCSSSQTAIIQKLQLTVGQNRIVSIAFLISRSLFAVAKADNDALDLQGISKRGQFHVVIVSSREQHAITISVESAWQLKPHSALIFCFFVNPQNLVYFCVLSVICLRRFPEIADDGEGLDKLLAWRHTWSHI